MGKNYGPKSLANFESYVLVLLEMFVVVFFLTLYQWCFKGDLATSKLHFSLKVRAECKLGSQNGNLDMRGELGQIVSR